jgi:hypothetical protein
MGFWMAASFIKHLVHGQRGLASEIEARTYGCGGLDDCARGRLSRAGL